MADKRVIIAVISMWMYRAFVSLRILVQVFFFFVRVALGSLLNFWFTSGIFHCSTAQQSDAIYAITR